MKNISVNAAKQLCDVIDILPEENKIKIPTYLYDYLKEKQKYCNDYKMQVFTPDDIEDKLIPESKKYLAYISIKYLFNDEEKEEYRTIVTENDVYKQKADREKYEVFKEFQTNSTNDSNNNSVALKKRSIFDKIIYKLHNVISKK